MGPIGLNWTRLLVMQEVFDTRLYNLHFRALSFCLYFYLSPNSLFFSIYTFPLSLSSSLSFPIFIFCLSLCSTHSFSFSFYFSVSLYGYRSVLVSHSSFSSSSLVCLSVCFLPDFFFSPFLVHVLYAGTMLPYGPDTLTK